MKVIIAASLSMLALTASVATAQPCGPAVQPNEPPIVLTTSSRLCVEASPDHNATNPDGTPKVTSYRYGHYLVGASAPVEDWDIGKPSLDPDGAFRYNPTQLMGIPLDVMYVAKVQAVGPSGTSAPSVPTQRFFRPAPLRAPPSAVFRPAP